MKTILVAISGLAASSALSVSAQAAASCGNITNEGECQDAETLVWCDDGVLATMVCNTGEVCTSHDNFGGAFGCIGTEYTACGNVDKIGECTPSGDVLWCDADQQSAYECPEGTTCGWVEDEGWYDCLDTAVVNAPDYEDRPQDPAWNEGDSDNTPDAPPDGHMPPRITEDNSPLADREGPTPEVTSGGAAAANDFESSGGGGCTGGAPVALPGLLTGLLLFFRRKGL